MVLYVNLEHNPYKGAPTNVYSGTDSMFLIFCGLEVPEIGLVGC